MSEIIKNIGKYEVIRILGKGATAIVYLAKEPETGAEVAVKLIRFSGDNKAMSRRLKKLFQTENSSGRRLDHPNIIKIYSAHIEEEYAYIVMEYVEGSSLEQYCTVSRLLPMHRAISIIFKCCMALDHAFRQGIVHRDIKPANILLDKDENPKISDFGLALNLRKNTSNDSTFVMGVGSPAYMSPEQIKNYPLDQKTDIYSLGVVLFQLLTGRLPFRGKNQAALIYRIINVDPPSVCTINPSLPKTLEPVVRKAMEKDLYTRYRNGAEFAKDLSSVRYQIVEEDTVKEDTTHFDYLRRFRFFAGFEDVEIWEVLRISLWREIPEKTAIVREGETNEIFGIIIDGLVEVSIESCLICKLGQGEVLGEMAYMHPLHHQRYATAVTLAPTIFLEVSSSALELCSDELQDHFRRALTGVIIDRLRKSNKRNMPFMPPAIGEIIEDTSVDIELLPP